MAHLWEEFRRCRLIPSRVNAEQSSIVTIESLPGGVTTSEYRFNHGGKHYDTLFRMGTCERFQTAKGSSGKTLNFPI
jgi:hypothetical protein